MDACEKPATEPEFAMLVSPTKLNSMREPVDFEITRRALELGLSRFDAALIVATEAGFFLNAYQIDGWCLVTFQTMADLESIRRLERKMDWASACERDIDSQFEANTVVAVNMDDAILAALILLQEPRAILFMDEFEKRRYYRRNIGIVIDRAIQKLDWYLRNQVWFQSLPCGLNIDFSACKSY